MIGTKKNLKICLILKKIIPWNILTVLGELPLASCNLGDLPVDPTMNHQRTKDCIKKYNHPVYPLLSTAGTKNMCQKSTMSYDLQKHVPKVYNELRFTKTCAKSLQWVTIYKPFVYRLYIFWMQNVKNIMLLNKHVVENVIPI